MDTDKAQINTISKFIDRDFKTGNSESLIPASDHSSIEELKAYLIEKLSFLLENKFEVLVNILYKIDVNENKLRELFSGINRESIPEKLTELIIERELQKAKSRMLYKTEGDR
jgi:hypothetical protein